MGRPDDASHTARGVLPSPPSPSPEFFSGNPSDGGGGDAHTENTRGNRAWNHPDIVSDPANFGNSVCICPRNC